MPPYDFVDSRPSPWIALALATLLAPAANAQTETVPPVEAPTQEVATPAPDIVDSEATIEIRGLAENRFNPTHGTVFFVLRGADFPTEPQDVAVLVNDAQIPSPRLSISRRIVGASYVMADGLNEVILRAWDSAGELMSADTLVWAGDRLVVIDVVDFNGQPIDGASVTVQLANQRAVQATSSAEGGVAQFPNLPAESLAITGRHPDGRSGEAVIPPEQQRALLVLR